MSPVRRRALALACLIAPRIQGQAPPEFAVGVDVVAVDVSVMDPDGKPLAGLQPADFTISVDGKPRRLLSAEFVTFEGASARTPAAPKEAPAAIVSNEGVKPGRLVLFAVDTGSLEAGSSRGVMQAATRLVDSLGPRDRVGLVSFPAPSVSVEPGPDLGAVRAALGKLVGRSRVRVRRVSVTEALAFNRNDSGRWDPVVQRECPPPGASAAAGPAAAGAADQDREVCVLGLEDEARQLANEAQQQSSQQLASLRALFEAFKDLEGTKIVVLVSGGTGIAEPSDVRALAEQATRARVNLHVLQVESRGGAGDLRTRDEDDRVQSEMGLRDLAVLSRGSLQRVTGFGERAFERVAREIEGYYLLGFEPEGADRDGRDHRVDVAVARPGARVRARKQLNIPTLAGPAKPAELLASALKAPFELGDLRLRAGVFRLPSLDGKQPRVLIGIEAGQPGDPQGETLAGAVLLDAHGKAGASGVAPARAAGEDRPRSAGLVLQAASGAWSLRVAGVDARGRRGRLDVALELRTGTHGKLEVSDLIFTPLGLAPGAGLVPMLDVDPTRAPAAVYAELAADKPAELERAAPAFELATSASAPALVSQSLKPRSLDARRVAVQALLPGDLLPPGEYVARLTLASGAPLTRPLRISLPATPAEAEQRAKALRPSADFLSSLVPAYKREDALRPELLEAVLAQLEARGALQGKPAAGVARARAGDWPGMLQALGSEGEAGFAFAFLRGLALYATGNSAAAGSQLRAAARVASDFFGVPLYLGACLATEGKEEQAIGAWQTALIGDGGKVPALYLLLSDSLLRTEQAAGAADVIDEALASWPRDAALVRRKALALALAGERAQSLELLGGLAQQQADANLLWAVLRLRFQDYLAGRGDTPALRRDAQAYLAAGGPQQALVKLWLERLAAR